MCEQPNNQFLTSKGPGAARVLRGQTDRAEKKQPQTKHRAGSAGK